MCEPMWKHTHTNIIRNTKHADEKADIKTTVIYKELFYNFKKITLGAISIVLNLSMFFWLQSEEYVSVLRYSDFCSNFGVWNVFLTTQWHKRPVHTNLMFDN